MLSQGEVGRLLDVVDGETVLPGSLLYVTGARLTERLRPSVKDVEFERRVTIVPAGKDNKDRLVMLAQTLCTSLKQQIARAHAFWVADRTAGNNGVELPDALGRKYPRAPSCGRRDDDDLRPRACAAE